MLVGRGIVTPGDFSSWLRIESPDFADARYARARNWFETEFTVSTYLLLANLRRSSLDSRSWFAATTANTVFWPAARRESAPAGLDPAARDHFRQQLMEFSELQIITLVFAAIEDLGRLLYAVQRPQKDIPRSLMSITPGRARRIFAKLAGRTPRGLWRVFPFVPPRRYGLRGEDAAAFERYYIATATATKQFLSFVAAFVDRQEAPYLHYLHGGTLLAGAQGIQGLEGIEYLVGVQTDPANPERLKSVPVGPLVTERLLLFAAQVVEFSKILVDRQLQIAEFVGTVPPVLLAARPSAEGRLFDAFTLGGHQFERPVEERGRAILAGLERFDVQVNLESELDRKSIQDLLDFYTQDWRLATFGPRAGEPVVTRE